MISDTIVSVFNKAWGLTWRRQRSRSSSQVIQYITCYSFHPHDCYYLFHTFYSKRTHSIVEEHILYPHNYTIMFSQVRSRSCLLPVWLGCVYVCAGETYLNKLPRHWEEALQKLGLQSRLRAWPTPARLGSVSRGPGFPRPREAKKFEPFFSEKRERESSLSLCLLFVFSFSPLPLLFLSLSLSLSPLACGWYLAEEELIF